MRFGFDFDNTLVNYDKAASIWGNVKGLKHIKTFDELKKIYLNQENYHEEWIEVQEWLYTEGIKYARFTPGVLELIEALYKKGSAIFIVSHKSHYSFKTNLDLIKPATTWLEFMISKSLSEFNIRYFFEESRAAKIQKIVDLQLTHFVDDLQIIFADKLFPKNVKGFLLSIHSPTDLPRNVVTIKNLGEVMRYV